MSRGETKDKGRARQYLLANALEAIIGATYLDQGYGVTKKFVLKHVAIKLQEILEKKLYLDPKSYFQEKAQENNKVTPSYRVMKEWGPDHDKHFVVGVYLADELIAEGEGNSKQEAQREAARLGLEAKKWL
jgi:ribonuclease-3